MAYKSPHPWPTPFLIFLISTTTSTPPPSQPPPPQPQPPNATLKPSITIIIGILTTIFSIIFLLLLYTKHCRRSNNGYTSSGVPVLTGRYIDRENSGIDRTIIESLPVFRFGSLSGHKDGLECAVCLSKFNPTEVLRLLPKCKHAFHVECVDTWLDAHSTCPLCRYRVDPEDIFLLLNENDISRDIPDIQASPPSEVKLQVFLHRVSGRHSSAGEKVAGIKIPPTGSRRSFDSSNIKKKVVKNLIKRNNETMSFKTVSADRQRKDGLLLSAADVVEEERRRLEHRIVVGPKRWSDVQPSDLLYLRSEMILSRPSVLHEGEKNNGLWQNGRGVINSRSVSEMTGLSRFGNNDEASGGVLSRWLLRLSDPKSGRNSSSSNV